MDRADYIFFDQKSYQNVHSGEQIVQFLTDSFIAKDLPNQPSAYNVRFVKEKGLNAHFCHQAENSQTWLDL